MNTKLSIALLSGISLFMSVGAFAVADEQSDDYLNWSYAMGELPAEVSAEVTPRVVEPVVEPTCTEGCPSRSTYNKETLELTLSYEDDAVPVADQMEIDSSMPMPEPIYVPVKEKKNLVAYSKPASQVQERPIVYQADAQVETRYVTTPARVEYPVTRQYPVSVEYPVTVQRNMTVEQPVIMQQPVIVRRPVVMQQEITVQRNPTVIQQQPVVMNQQPTYVQQQPMYIQAPAQPIPPAMMSQIMPQNVQMAIPQQVFAQQPMVMPQPMMPVMAQQYQVQMPVQPMYMAPEMPYAGQPVSPVQQPVYPNSAQ